MKYKMNHTSTHLGPRKFDSYLFRSSEGTERRFESRLLAVQWFQEECVDREFKYTLFGIDKNEVEIELGTFWYSIPLKKNKPMGLVETLFPGKTYRELSPEEVRVINREYARISRSINPRRSYTLTAQDLFQKPYKVCTEEEKRIVKESTKR